MDEPQNLGPETLANSLSKNNLIHLRRLLNDIHNHPTFLANNSRRLAAADLAYVSYQASLNDGARGHDDFHPDFMEFRSGTADGAARLDIQREMRWAMFDHAAKLDHSTGSTTLVVHIPGALQPRVPSLPEFIKAYVYVPGTVIRECETTNGHNPVPDLIDTIIHTLGPPTVERFDRARKKLWNFPQSVHPPAQRSLPQIEGMPIAIPAESSRYIFYGKKRESLTGRGEDVQVEAPDLSRSQTLSTTGTYDLDRYP